MLKGLFTPSTTTADRSSSFECRAHEIPLDNTVSNGSVGSNLPSPRLRPAGPLNLTSQNRTDSKSEAAFWPPQKLDRHRAELHELAIVHFGFQSRIL